MDLENLISQEQDFDELEELLLDNQFIEKIVYLPNLEELFAIIDSHIIQKLTESRNIAQSTKLLQAYRAFCCSIDKLQRCQSQNVSN